MAQKLSDEVAFRVEIASRRIEALPETTLAAIGIEERKDLQEWVVAHPELIESDLLLVTTEFGRWELRDKPVADRLDVLFLDSDGHLLVAELKRGGTQNATDLQALKYAAYCSDLTVDDVVEEHARFNKLSDEDALAAVHAHAPSLVDGELQPIRVRLVASHFGPSVAHVVLFLHAELGLDIGCIQITVRMSGADHATLTARQLLPPPLAENYLVRRRRRKEEEAKGASSKRRNSVTVLTEAGAIRDGEVLKLKVAFLTAAQQAKVAALLEHEPDAGIAEWTGLGIRNALRWRKDGETHSCSWIVEKMLADLGVPATAVDGPGCWLLPNGKTIYDRAVEVADNGSVLPASAPNGVAGGG